MPKKFILPKEWKDEGARKDAAAYICQLIDAYLSDGTLTEKFSRYRMAQDVFNDKTVLSKWDFGDGIVPYNAPMFRRQVKGVVRLVVSAFNGADPYFIFKGGDNTDLRSAREKDTQMLLESDGYKGKIRDAARNAALWARGPYRVAWQKRRKGQGWSSPQEVKDAEIEFAGPTREIIMPWDLVVYPLSQSYITDARLICHRLDRPMYEIWQEQDEGHYISKDELTVDALHEQETAAQFEEDYSPNLYAGVIKLWPGMDRHKELVAYEFVVAKGQQAILAISSFEDPMPPYFAPGFEFDPMEFWAEHSVATSMFESQTILNDVQTTRVMSAIASSKRTVLASGFVGEQTSYPLGLGDLVTFRGDPKFTVIDTSSPPPRDLQFMSFESRKDMEGVSGFSDLAAGQLPMGPKQTATAASVAAAGTSEEGEEKRENFMAEEIRFVEYVQHLCSKPENFTDLVEHYGERLSTKSAEDWKPGFTIAANGQGTANNPQLSLQKVSSLTDVKEKFQIPWLDEVKRGAPDVGIALDRLKMFKAAVQIIDPPFNVDQVVIETPGVRDAEQGNIAGPGGPTQGGEQPMGATGAGAAGGDPSELLGALISASQGGVPPGAAGGPAAGLDPGIVALIGSLVGGGGQLGAA